MSPREYNKSFILNETSHESLGAAVKQNLWQIKSKMFMNLQTHTMNTNSGDLEPSYKGLRSHSSESYEPMEQDSVVRLT